MKCEFKHEILSAYFWMLKYYYYIRPFFISMLIRNNIKLWMETPKEFMNLTLIFIGTCYEFQTFRRETEHNFSLINPLSFKSFLLYFEPVSLGVLFIVCLPASMIMWNFLKPGHLQNFLISRGHSSSKCGYFECITPILTAI